MIPRIELTPGYSISRLVHGGWQFSTGHRLSGEEVDDAVEVLTASAELGVTTFDCADIYTGVEELYGRFLRHWRTTSVAAPIQIHTKFVPDDSALASLDRTYVRDVVHRSLRRLGVDRVDLVQFHWWRTEVSGMEEAAGWLDELREEGKVRHVAVTNMNVRSLERLADAGIPVVSDQVQYSVLDRRPESRLAARCASCATRIIAYGALAGGFLTDRWLGVADPGAATNRSLVKYRLIIDEFGGWDAYQGLLEVLAGVASEKGVETSAVALRFVLDQPEVAGVVCGATRKGQMRRNAAAFSFDLSPEDVARIRSRTDAAAGPDGDVFELERDREGPHGRIMKYELNRA